MSKTYRPLLDIADLDTNSKWEVSEDAPIGTRKVLHHSRKSGGKASVDRREMSRRDRVHLMYSVRYGVKNLGKADFRAFPSPLVEAVEQARIRYFTDTHLGPSHREQAKVRAIANRIVAAGLRGNHLSVIPVLVEAMDVLGSVVRNFEKAALYSPENDRTQLQQFSHAVASQVRRLIWDINEWDEIGDDEIIKDFESGLTNLFSTAVTYGANMGDEGDLREEAKTLWLVKTLYFYGQDHKQRSKRQAEKSKRKAQARKESGELQRTGVDEEQLAQKLELAGLAEGEGTLGIDRDGASSSASAPGYDYDDEGDYYDADEEGSAWNLDGVEMPERTAEGRRLAQRALGTHNEMRVEVHAQPVKVEHSRVDRFDHEESLPPEVEKGLSPILKRFGSSSYYGHEDGAVHGRPMLYEPPRPFALPAKIKGRTKRPTARGKSLRHAHRWTTDKRVFSSPMSGIQGTVLFDQSGSMGLSTEDIIKLMTLLPAVTIAGYVGRPLVGADGTSYDGSIAILAKNGQRVHEEHIRSFPEGYIRDRDGSLVTMLAPRGGANSVDGGALSWLAEQAKPRIWVSDGGVTGVEARGRGGDVFAKNIFDDCVAIVKRAHIITLPSAEAVIRFSEKRKKS